MFQRSLDELEAESHDFDAAVLASADLDPFCSSTLWGLPAARAFAPERQPYIHRGVHGWAAFMQSTRTDVRLLEPLECVWLLGCPLVGPEPYPLARELAQHCAFNAPDAALAIAGIDERSARFPAILRAFGPRWSLRRGPVTRAYVADLAGGPDGFMSRRTTGFRTSLRRALRGASERGLTYESQVVTPHLVDHAWARLRAVENASWKGMAGVGLAVGGMDAFYRAMLGLLAARGAVRLLFAREGERDVAYILGGVLGGVYRGLQFSYRDGFDTLSLGNVMQYRMIERLCAEGVTHYDLGSDVEYKRRWGEIVRETITVIAIPVLSMR